MIVAPALPKSRATNGTSQDAYMQNMVNLICNEQVDEESTNDFEDALNTLSVDGLFGEADESDGSGGLVLCGVVHCGWFWWPVLPSKCPKLFWRF